MASKKTGERGPYVPRPYDPEKHCGAPVQRDPKILQGRLDEIEVRIAAYRARVDAGEDLGPRDGAKFKYSLLLAVRLQDRIGKAVVGDDRPCIQLKGHGTDHLGNGSCRSHCFCKGKPNMHASGKKHGVYSSSKSAKLLEYLDKLDEAGTDLLDLTPDVKMLRAKIMQFCDESEGLLSADQVKGISLLAESLRRMVETINEMKLRTAITKEVFDVIQQRMAEIVMKYITDPDILEKIAVDWSRILVDPATKRQRAIAGASE